MHDKETEKYFSVIYTQNSNPVKLIHFWVLNDINSMAEKEILQNITSLGLFTETQQATSWTRVIHFSLSLWSPSLAKIYITIKNVIILSSHKVTGFSYIRFSIDKHSFNW